MSKPRSSPHDLLPPATFLLGSHSGTVTERFTEPDKALPVSQKLGQRELGGIFAFGKQLAGDDMLVRSILGAKEPRRLGLYMLSKAGVPLHTELRVFAENKPPTEDNTSVTLLTSELQNVSGEGFFVSTPDEDDSEPFNVPHEVAEKFIASLARAATRLPFNNPLQPKHKHLSPEDIVGALLAHAAHTLKDSLETNVGGNALNIAIKRSIQPNTPPKIALARISIFRDEGHEDPSEYTALFARRGVKDKLTTKLKASVGAELTTRESVSEMMNSVLGSSIEF